MTCAIPVSTAFGGEPSLTYIVPIAAGSSDGASSRPTLPDLIVTDGSGMPAHLRQFSGQVVVLNFWSTSCGPCLKELLLLDRLQGNFRGQALTVLALSEDQNTISVVKSFLNRQKYSYLRPFIDPASAAALTLGVSSLPTSLILDRHNRLVFRIQGSYPWEDPKTTAGLRTLLSEP